MKVSTINQNMNFKSGLTSEIVQAEKLINPKSVEHYFKKSPYADWGDFGTNLDFKNYKSIALACKMCANIFIQLRKKHDYRKGASMQDLVFPHGICVFNEKDLTTPPKNGTHNFCTTTQGQNDFFKNKKYIERNTILICDEYQTLEEMNDQMEDNKRRWFLSSGHFLHCYVHEWIHAIQGKLIYNLTSDLGYGNYDKTINTYLNQQVSPEENEIVEDVLGRYAAIQGPGVHQYSEIFAEAWTKFICNSLDKDCIHFKKDPIDELKNTPKEFREILKKVSTVEIKNIWGNSKNHNITSFKEGDWDASEYKDPVPNTIKNYMDKVTKKISKNKKNTNSHTN